MILFQDIVHYAMNYVNNAIKFIKKMKVLKEGALIATDYALLVKPIIIFLASITKIKENLMRDSVQIAKG
jgi:hypothetical protein